MFCDICDFDGVIKELQDNVIQLLDDVFRTFDSLCKEFGIQKIEVIRFYKTVGKTYMACGGLKFIESTLDRELSSKSPVIRTVQLAQAMGKFIDDYTYKAGKRLEIKIGVHYGQCIFGVLGYHKPQFSLIGDTINTTSRHCTTGKNGNIVLSEACYNEIKAAKIVSVIPNKVFMKGKSESEVTVYIISKYKKKVSKKAKKDDRISALQNRRISFNPSLHGSFLRGAQLNSRGSIAPPKGRKALASGELGDSQRFDSQMEDDSQLENNSIQLEGGGPYVIDSSMASERVGSQSILQDVNQPAEEVELALGQMRSQTLAVEDKPAAMSKLTEGDKEDIYLDDPLDDQQETEIMKNDQKRKFFERKILIEYSFSINVALCLLVAETAFRELLIWIDSRAVQKFQYFRFVNGILAVFLLILVVLKQMRDNLKAFKLMICLAIFLRTILQILEYFLVYYTAYLSKPLRQYRLPQISFNVIQLATIDLTFLVSLGIFYFRDVAIVSGLLSFLVVFFYVYFGTAFSFIAIFRLVTIVAFNLMDTWKINKREILTMFKIIKTKKESTYLSKFVDRLLPKHVLSYD